ncbi:protein N-terminal glutamine amidohydrolase-like [Ruditapes philippinarum]|uniref:protein N-terminal glutamine amidohydrolase-like n=1 Tax=Ruditapes philippinarum TaxID=129788 RepID=UPI00295C2ADE|nr:protein N-terminal glutamine amidohydrolase-like [Ruditapes philippinarum]
MTGVPDSADFAKTTLFKSKKDCVYTSCYCEENVWKLANEVKEKHSKELGNCFCVFISNESQSIPLWEQAPSQREDGLVIWDYHVIFLHKAQDGSYIYDLDTKLDFPCMFSHYIDRGIQSCDKFKKEFHRQFRVIPADEFLSTFASDRSHMLDEDGKWLKTPPSYPCIQTKDAINNIKDFISMDPEVGVGKIMDFWQFCDTFIEKDTS